VQIDVDTNRDGVVQSEPQDHKQEFTNEYGAIVLVNTDDNRSPPKPPYLMPRDAIDDQLIPNAADEAQLSQIVIQKLGVDTIPKNWVITLTLLAPLNEPASFSEVFAEERIRIYYVDNSQNFPNKYVPILGRDIGATYTFPNPPVKPQPDLSGNGTLTLYMEGCEYGLDVFIVLTVTTGGNVVGKDQVRVMPTPLVFLSNIRTVQRCWVHDDGSAPGSDTGAVRDRIVGLLGAGATAYTETDDQWPQDEWELGMTSSPPIGAPVVWTNGVNLPRYRGLDEYEQAYMRGPVPDATAVYGGWAWIYANTQTTAPENYGGNLEVSPPTANFPLGLLTIGDTMSDDELLAFLARQRLQTLGAANNWAAAKVDTSWLSVGHVDEVMCYVPAADGTQGFKIVVADPGLAYDLLHPTPDPAVTSAQSYTTFFYEGTHEEVGVVTALCGNNQIINDNVNLPQRVAASNYNFVRIYNGAGSGQVAAIDRQATQALGDSGVTNTLVVNSVWDVPGSEAVRNALLGISVPQSQNQWFTSPDRGSVYVLVEGTKWWVAGDNAGTKFPAIITSFEVRNDETMWNRNLNYGNTARGAKGRIDVAIRHLCMTLGIDYINDVIRVPQMYLIGGNDGSQVLLNRLSRWAIPSICGFLQKEINMSDQPRSRLTWPEPIREDGAHRIALRYPGVCSRCKMAVGRITRPASLGGVAQYASDQRRNSTRHGLPTTSHYRNRRAFVGDDWIQDGGR
jgi:hypothetical protein